MYPFFNIFGKQVSAYGVMAVIGIIFSAVYAVIRSRQKKLNGNDMMYFLTFAFCGLLIGAFLLHQTLEVIKNYRYIPYLFTDFKKFLNNWHVGLVFYGGLYGTLFGCMAYSKFFRQDTRDFFMYMTPIIPLFHIFGRIGCFLVGCCHGMEHETLGIAYTNAVGGNNGVPYLPVQLYEAFGELVIFIVLCINQRGIKKHYQPVGIYLTAYGVMRFVLEFFRGDAVRGHLGFLSTSQWISLVTIPLGIYCLAVKPEKNFLNRMFTPRKSRAQE